MKKSIFLSIVICVITILILVFCNNTDNRELSYEGSKFLLHATINQQNGIVIYGYSNNEYDEMMLEGSQALFGENECRGQQHEQLTQNGDCQADDAMTQCLHGGNTDDIKACDQER